MSSSSVKGLLKGLRYISQIFETGKEEEIVIGLPTDVKHVAHIGNDGPSSSNTPSWMNKFQGRSETSSTDLSNGKPPTKQTTKSSNKDLKIQGTRDVQKNSEAPLESPNRGKSRQSRHHKAGSPGREVMAVEKARHHKQPGIESPGRKKHSNVESPRRASSSKLGAESPSRDTNASPKPARRKKKVGSSGEGATRSKSRLTELQNTAHPHSDPGPGRDKGSDGICQKSILDKYKDQEL